MTDTISAIIPAYNAAAYVGRAIESALSQTSPPLEILVIDDGSQDHTADVVSGFAPRVRLVQRPNGGPAAARNLGAKLASGTWLAFLDADDWWHPTKLAAQLKLAASPDIGLVHCLPDHKTETVPNRISFDDLWARNWIANSSVIVRRDVFEEQGGFDEAKELISVEDYNLWIRVAASNWTIVTCQEVLLHYTPGVGISSNFDRFTRASLYNVCALQRALNLPPAMAKKRRNDLLVQFGQQALSQRDLASARALLWRALAERKSAYTCLYLLASLLPRSVLDMRRNAVRRPDSAARRLDQLH